MYIDHQMLLSDEQALVATAASTNVVNLSAARKFFGGKPLFVVVCVDVAFTTATSYEIQVCTDVDGTIDGSSTVQITTGAIAIASLTIARSPIVIPIGAVLGTEQQYLGLYYIEAGSTEETGTVTAFITADPQTNV